MRNKKIEICPSILSANFRKLEQEVKDVEAAGADRIHCDVMDGHFVPNLTFGPMVIECVKKSVSIPLDVHLMISNPEEYIDNYCDAGADILTVHAEVCKDGLPDILKAIHDKGVKTGVTVNPDKGVELFLPHLKKIDQVLVMTVYAGFGGQKFIADMLPKINRIFNEANALSYDLDIQVDGGINHETAAVCAENGANVFVAGNYIFSADNYQKKIQALRDSALNGLNKTM